MDNKKPSTPKEIAMLELKSEKNRDLGHHQGMLARTLRDIATYEDNSKNSDWMSETDYEVAKAKVPVLREAIKGMTTVSVGSSKGITVG